MARFFVPAASLTAKRFTLEGSEARHALKVLRLKEGDEIDCFDGKDSAFRARIVSVSGTDRLSADILDARVPSRDVSASVTLCQALLKGPKWDWLIEKASEIGVDRLIPLHTRRTVVHETDRDARKLDRWQKIAVASAKQCGRERVMTIDAPVLFVDLWASKPDTALTLIPWEKEESTPLRMPEGKNVWILIGPEGGWDPAEIKLAEKHGARPVRLGPTLLRAETAGIVAATLALREMGIY